MREGTEFTYRSCSLATERENGTIVPATTWLRVSLHRPPSNRQKNTDVDTAHKYSSLLSPRPLFRLLRVLRYHYRKLNFLKDCCEKASGNNH